MLRQLLVSGEGADRSGPAYDEPALNAANRDRGQGDRQPGPGVPIPLIQAQVEELVQTKVESNSRMPVRLFGTILSNTSYNSGEAN